MASRPIGSGVPTDAELVRRTRAGRRQAFDELVERYQRRATSIAYRLLGNVHDALEVCQEAFVRAYRNLHTLDDETRFGPWLLRIVTNLSLNARRCRRPRLTLDNGQLDEIASAGSPTYRRLHPGDGPTARLAATELADHIRHELAELPEAQRTALVLFSIEELPQRQVAEIMGCSVEAVKWHVFQARRKMKTRLAEFL